MHFKFNQIAFVCTRKMKQRMSHFHYFVFVLLLSFGLSSSFTWVPNPFRTQYVRIINNLNNELLDGHCIFADNDLSLKTLQPKGEWEFSFRPNFQRMTLFYCYFFYGSFHADFDVYAATYKWKWACGGDHCIWIVQEDGFYLYQIQKDENVKKHDWEKNI